jgi:hypothetical protein
MQLKNLDTGVALPLPDDLLWSDEHAWSPFPDISELDRAGGRVNLRKSFVQVATDDTDTYFGANVIVAEPPQDERVSVTLFSTRKTFDTREQAQTRIEAYLNKGPEWAATCSRTTLRASG